jgi:DNA-directed RNA polymerase subunit L
METIAETFANRFARWKITIPQENLENLENDHIQEAGWLIQYCFGKDEKGEYLDYYAAHRMTDDSHVRIYQDGQIERLPALDSFRKASRDPEEDQRLEEEYYHHNQQVARELAMKGFNKFTINMFLHAGLDKQ